MCLKVCPKPKENKLPSKLVKTPLKNLDTVGRMNQNFLKVSFCLDLVGDVKRQKVEQTGTCDILGWNFNCHPYDGGDRTETILWSKKGDDLG